MSKFEADSSANPQKEASSATDRLLSDSKNDSAPSQIAQVESDLPHIFGHPTVTECESNAVYDHFIDELYMRSFDLEGLPDKHEAKTKFNCRIKSDEDGLKFADQFTSETADAHDDIWTKEEIELFRKQANGKPRGIGVKFQANLDESNQTMAKGPILVEYVEPGSSAQIAGLRRGDKVLKIDDIDTSGDDVNAIGMAQYITGNPSDSVKLVVDRNGESHEFEVNKAEIERSGVRGQMDGNIAYIKIDSFLDKDLSKDLKVLLERFKDADAFVIDVRDNVGGHLSQGIEAATLFVDNGTILTTKDRVRSDPENPVYDEKTYSVTEDHFQMKVKQGSGGRTELSRPRLPDLVDKPVRVLTNGYSASASEIFAAALQENGAAKLVGAKTFGKGDGQTVASDFPMGSALKYTSFRYYSPDGNWFGNGGSIKNGIAPDIVALNTPGTLRYSPSDNQYQIALRSIARELEQSK